eukprot:4040692-Prymnesium_polylepis.1
MSDRVLGPRATRRLYGFKHKAVSRKTQREPTLRDVSSCLELASRNTWHTPTASDSPKSSKHPPA